MAGETNEALHTRALLLKGGRRTSARLEEPLWQAYDRVCEETGIGRNVLSQMIDTRRPPRVGMTNALRIFLVSYFRSAAGRTGLTRCDAQSLDLAAALDTIGPIAAPGWVAEGPTRDTWDSSSYSAD